MSTTIDQRVVEMRFDNKHFESNVADTMSTLDKFKQKLNLDGATKGLESVNTAAQRVDMSTLGTAVETVGLKFNALWTVADQALRNITNSVLASAKKTASAFTIDPIKTGFSEYETQMNAVQTILANTESKGSTLQDVNRALNELNTYADKTIYNFTEMTRNIGTFTAAGIDLDTSVNAIQGIANLAAVSGSTSQQASTAMYQLSQALSSGTVKLMDWNSVVNAGMGGQVFQDALKETARNHGIAIDSIIEKNGSFRESLQEGWLTKDVLTETLSHFTMAAEEGSEAWEAYKKSLMDDGYTEEQALNILKLSNTATDAATKVKTFSQLMDTLKEAAQSGWTQSWQILIGDFEEAKGLFTDISDRLGAMIGESAEARNAMLSGGLSSGWKQLLDQGIADEEGYKETFKDVAKEHNISIDDMIAAEKKLDDSLSDTEAFQKALNTGIKEGTLTSDMFSDSVHKMADKMAGMSSEELKAAGYTVEHVEEIKKLSAGLKDGSVSMDEFVKKMARPSGRENIIQSLWNAFDGLMSVIEPVREALREIFPPITGEQLYAFTEGLKAFTEKLTLSETASNNLKRTFKGLFAVVDIVKEIFVAAFKAIKPLFGGLDDLGGGILDTTAKMGDWLVNLRNSIKQGDVFGKAVKKIHEAFAKISEFLQPAIDGIKEFVAMLSKDIVTATSNAEVRLSPLVTLCNIIKGVFVAIGNAVKQVLPYVHAAATGIGNVLRSLMDKISSSIQGADYNAIFDLANGGIFTAIGIFIAKFMKSGSDILDGAGGFLENINGILEGVGDALGAFTDSLKADTLKKIATAIAILAASLFVLALIDSEKLTLSLTAVTALFGELMGSMAIFNKMGDIKGVGKVAASLVGLSSAVLILAVALKVMSTMSWEEMGVGLISMTVGLGALVGAVNLLPDKKVKSAAKAIKTMSFAILILAAALKVMGTMSWEEMGVGLISMVVGLGALVGAVNLLPKDTALRAAGMVGLATAMVILGAALKIMATMSWEEIARSLVTLAGSLAILAGAMAIMKRGIPGALAMTIIAPALITLAGAMKIMATMSWEEIAKSIVTLGGSLLILAGAMAIMTNAVPGALAMTIVAPALVVLAGALKLMATMTWEEIAKGMVAIAGAFAILGVAALILSPVVGTVFALSGSLMFLGIACATIGAGVLMCGIGLTTLAGALAASGGAITLFVSSLVSLIPYLIEQIGVGIIKLCEVISGSAAAICDAVTVIIVAIVDALVASVPAIVEGVFVLITELLNSLVDYTPLIVTALFDFLIGILNTIAKKLPELIQAGVDLLMAFFVGVVDALKSIDPTVLINGIIAVGLLTAIVAAMAAVALMTPLAMAGVLGMGAVVTELAFVLSAFGALAQIPGLDWLISEGGQLMHTIGTAIGQFVGGIAGGFAEGMSSALPQVGADLTAFMDNASGFIEGAKSIDTATLDGVKSIVGIIAALTAVDILEGLTSWLTGGSSLTKFGEELAAFGPNIKAYSDAVADIDPSTITASAEAAQALADMTSHIPNEGGVIAWFTGENSIAKFGTELVTLGEGLSAYSNAIVGFNAEAVIASANAAQALADMTSHIPNEGGVVSWFAGDNSISKFGTELVSLGTSLSEYSNAIVGFNAEAVIASANAAKALADMTSYIPNEGGVVSWFAGDNSIAKFAGELVMLGCGLKGYSDSIAGINVEAVTASANAAKTLAEMTSYIPNEGGVISWFTGENSIAKFAGELVVLGSGLMGFSAAVTGINTESVTAAANAAKTLAEMASYIPNEGGVVAWLAGENSISKFSGDLECLGEGLKGFSTSVEGIVPENITAAAGAAKALAEMASVIPNEGGVVAWFTGENSMTTFAGYLPKLGEGLKGFSDAVAGIVPENVTAAANAAKSLAQMAETTPGDTTKLISFGDNLDQFGGKLKIFFEKMSKVNAGMIGTATNAIKSIKDISSGLNVDSFSKASDAIDELVKSINNMSKVKAGAADGFSSAIKKLAETNVDSMIKAFKNAGTDMKNAGKDLMTKFIEGVKGQNSNLNKAGKTAIEEFINGIKDSESKAEKASKNLVTGCSRAISDMSTSFKSAGRDLGAGLVQGINAKKTAVYNAAFALGQKAVQGEKDGQESNSPSKATIRAGKWLGEGLVVGIGEMGNKVYNAGSSLGKNATKSISSSISRISELVSSDIDSQPTIRPVLDLSDVRAGAGEISSMFGGPSVGLLANVGSISSMMNERNQNGGNTDVVSAIDKLRKDMSSMNRPSYNINGINVSEGSDAAEAISTLVGYIVREGRS